MSTKTTFKRIALVAVASLGFGMLSVAPSSALTFTVNEPVALTTAPFLASTTVGAAATNVVTFTLTTNTGVTGDAVAFTASVAVKPTGSVAVPTLTMGTTSAAARYTLAQTSASVVTATIGATPAAITADALGTISFTPDVPGEYRIVVTPVATLVTGGLLAASTGLAHFSVYASGLGFSVAASGVGSSSVTAVAGGLVTANFTPSTTAGASVNLTRYVVTTTLGAPITSASGTIYTLPTTGATAGIGTRAAVTSGAANGVIAPFNGSTADYSAGASFIDGTDLTPHTYSAVISTPTAGTYTVTVTRITAATGVPAVLATGSITVGASAPSAAAALSTAFIGAGTAFAAAEATAASMRFPSTAAATVHANISVTLNDANGVAINGQSISATVSGPGLITATAGNGAAQRGLVRAVSIAAADQTTNQFTIGISADGTRGVSTITVLRGTTVIATKTVTFYGSVATLTATQTASIMRSGRTAASTVSDFVLGGSNAAELATAAITRATATNIAIVAKDVDGNVVPGLTVTADISDVAVISDVTITPCTGTALTVCASGAGNWIASTTPAIGGVSGAKATVTFKTPNPLVPGGFISTAAVPFSLGGTQVGGTVTMTLNKATYEPGERVIITYTAKDSAGNPVRDWTTAATPTANKNLPGLAGGTFVGGTVVIGDEAGELVYAPVSPGAFIITLATGTATGAEITATATVADDAATAAASAAGDAAAEATDAANAATDAANAAAEAADAATAAAQDAADAVAALSTSVTAMVDALRKQITSLTNLVIKIQKKVKA
jgi:hypothetical protein